MAIALLNAIEGELENNYAEFENDETSDDLGTLNWDTPIFNETTQKWDVPNVYGTDVEGNGFESGTLDDIPTSEKGNPTKIFWWIVGKIKSTLCPECM